MPGAGAGQPSTSSSCCTAAGVWVQRADPMAAYTEVPPATARSSGMAQYHWQDAAWLAPAPAATRTIGPMSVYEVHVGSWRPGLGYRDLADQLVDYVLRAGLHARGVHAAGGASVRRLVGLPGHRLLRPDQPVRHIRTTCATSSTGCTRPASA